MKYKIVIDVSNDSGVDVASLGGVLSYVITNSIKQLPGVLDTTVEAILTTPDDPPVEETPTDPLPESPPVDEPPVDSPSTE